MFLKLLIGAHKRDDIAVTARIHVLQDFAAAYAEMTRRESTRLGRQAQRIRVTTLKAGLSRDSAIATSTIAIMLREYVDYALAGEHPFGYGCWFSHVKPNVIMLVRSFCRLKTLCRLQFDRLELAEIYRGATNLDYDIHSGKLCSPPPAELKTWAQVMIDGVRAPLGGFEHALLNQIRRSWESSRNASRGLGKYEWERRAAFGYFKDLVDLVPISQNAGDRAVQRSLATFPAPTASCSAVCFCSAAKAAVKWFAAHSGLRDIKERDGV
jgi:hypothetical protein